ncbi:MAG: hypothetical protein AB7E85_04600 [Pseudobdellovibrionaceae bacterium]
MGNVSDMVDMRVLKTREDFMVACAHRFGENADYMALPRMLYHTREVVDRHAAFGDQSVNDALYRLHLRAMLCAYRDVVTALENSEDMMIRTPQYEDAVFGVMARLGACFSEDILPVDDIETDVARLSLTIRP